MTDLDLDAIVKRTDTQRPSRTDVQALVAEVRRLRVDCDRLSDVLADVNDEAGRARAAVARVRALADTIEQEIAFYSEPGRETVVDRIRRALEGEA